ncbi:cysteine-rich protein 3 isoform X2 [Mus musculus]|uniref:cysteine-rich protein 3 isoform X2 n=1 Tax=Mus musculus TaxID=10090 RepID=UPI0003D76AF7|nr:cysteine-rich protein 3 isoform X2 [Mus musculus]|eukprot:XP_006523553.1 PREDICTED: cysteine-rich protein 3 isoform X2 [Mus musculus]
MSWTCPRCQQPVYFAEKVSSLGKNWHRFCLKCERCHSILSPGGHAEGSTLVVWAAISTTSQLPLLPAAFPSAPATLAPPGQGLASPGPRKPYPEPLPIKGPPYLKTFTGETSLCPGCGDPVFFAEKVMSLGRNWHRPCLRCQRCRKTLTAGSHAEHDGMPYCHIPCYGYLFGPKGGQSDPRHWTYENVWTTSLVVRHLDPSPIPSDLHSLANKALGDRALSFRCEHWRCGLLHL